MIKKIDELLDKKVRPSLKLHGGDVEIISLKDNVLRIKMLGACSSCPSAQLTNEELIKDAVMEEFKEIEDVILVNEVSEELLDMAKKILKK